MTRDGQNGSADKWSAMKCEKLTARPGQRDALVAVLRRGAEELKSAGCDFHVSLSQDHPDAVWVTQVWTSREADRASLGLPTVRRALAGAIPLLTDQPSQAGLSAR
jgi:quinol monooxygenase YgiN